MVEQILGSIQIDNGRMVAHWNGIILESVFQPVFGVAQRRIIGFEALARGRGPNGQPLYPQGIFPMAKTTEEIVFLDRLLRSLHLLNFREMSDHSFWLFLNVNPVVATRGRNYGRFFEDILSWTGIHPHQLVIEILESAIEQEVLLSEAAEYYRSCGTLIAIDDFGAGHSNFNRIWSIKPEIVKLDRSTILHASKNSEVRRVLPELVGLIRASGSLCLIEGVETSDECRIALGTDVDFLQGFYFSHPHKKPDLTSSQRFDDIIDSTRQQNRDREDRDHLNRIIDLFLALVGEAENGRSREILLQIFSEFPCSIRYFVLDHRGRQYGDNQERLSSNTQDSRFHPLNDTKRALWSHRGYFRHAVSNPGHLHISSPYLSTTGVHMCRTLSIAISTTKGLFVHCLDLDWRADTSSSIHQ